MTRKKVNIRLIMKKCPVCDKGCKNVNLHIKMKALSPYAKDRMKHLKWLKEIGKI